MPSGKSDEFPKKIDETPFNGLMKAINDFFYDGPMKDFFESIDDLLKKPLPGAMIPINTRETKDYYIIEAELPGVNREQIQLDFNHHFVTITVLKQEIIEQIDDKEQLFHKSHSYQQSSRTIPLPYPVLEHEIKASFKNGLLEIQVPRQKNKRINIE